MSGVGLHDATFREGSPTEPSVDPWSNPENRTPTWSLNGSLDLKRWAWLAEAVLETVLLGLSNHASKPFRGYGPASPD